MKVSILTPPSGEEILKEVGENIKLAGQLSMMNTQQLADLATISRATLWQIEKGSPSVSIGAYYMALSALGRGNDFLKLGHSSIDRELRKNGFQIRKRAPKQQPIDGEILPIDGDDIF